MHTIIATPDFHTQFENVDMSKCEWAMNVVNGKLEDYGVDLVDKTYPSKSREVC